MKCQTETEKHCMISLIHGICDLIQQTNVKTRNTVTDTEYKLVVTSGKEGRGNTGVGEWKVQTIGIK